MTSPSRRRTAGPSTTLTLLLALIPIFMVWTTRGAAAAAMSSTQAAATGASKFWVCTWRIGGAAYYVSDVFSSSLAASDLVPLFRTFVAAKYHLDANPGGAAFCTAESSDASAQTLKHENLANPPGSYKAIDTGWKYGAPVVGTTTSSNPSSPADNPHGAGAPVFNPHGDSAPLPNPHGASTPLPASTTIADRLPMFCWLAYGTGRDDRVAYITKVFMAPLAAGDQGHIAGQFEAFIRKTYGQTTRGASCPEQRAADAVGLAAAEKNRESELDDLRDPTIAKIKIVDVDWTPTVPTVPTPTPAGAAKPAAAPTQQTFEQALATQRPATTGTPARKPAVAGTKYSYCIAVGGPRRSTELHAYVTPVFASVPGVDPETGFGAFVRGAHPQEAFGTVHCGYPQTQDLAESARLDEIKSRRSNPQLQVVDVSWAPVK
jgi:hypothetical protein